MNYRERFLINSARQLVWAKKAVRRDSENAGVKVLPCNFYSSVPSITEIENSFEYSSVQPPYADSPIFGLPETSRDLLETLNGYSSEFQPAEDGSEESPVAFFWKNSQFSYSDAMSYFGFIRHFKPSRVVEIGAGFSTLVAMDAIAKNGTGEITCVEPFPRAFLEKTDKIFLKNCHSRKLLSNGSTAICATEMFYSLIPRTL